MSEYNVRKITDMKSGLKSDLLLQSGYTHYLCRWSGDNSRNNPVKPYKSASAAMRSAGRRNQSAQQ